MDTAVFDKKVHERNKAQGRKNFMAGMAFEFVVLAKEKKKALFAIRSAGSHSLIDIMAVRSNETRLISVKKNGTWLQKEIDDLVDLKDKIAEGHNVYLVYLDKESKKYTIEKL